MSIIAYIFFIHIFQRVQISTQRKKEKNVTATIYTKNIIAQLELDIKKHNTKELYRIGASLRDLGKAWFAFSKFEMESFDILSRLEG